MLAHYNLKPDRNNQIKCPFHEDYKPSCRIYADTNTFHCFGCNTTGDQIEFIERYEKCSKHEAILKAQQLCGIPEPIETEKLKAKPTLINGTDILTEAFIHFARSLNAKPEKALKYQIFRKLDYNKLAIGYDAGTLHKTKETTTKQKQLYLQTGLLKPDKFGRENSYYTRFNNCIVFPLLDKSGNIASLYGRHIESSHHYLEGDHKGLYPKYPGQETTRLILTEAIINAATLLQLTEITKDFAILALYRPGNVNLSKENKIFVLAVTLSNTEAYTFEDDIYDYIILDSLRTFIIVCVDDKSNVIGYTDTEEPGYYVDIKDDFYSHDRSRRRQIRKGIKNIKKENPEIILFCYAFWSSFMYIKENKIYAYDTKKDNSKELNELVREVSDINLIRRSNFILWPLSKELEIGSHPIKYRLTGHTQVNVARICPALR